MIQKSLPHQELILEGTGGDRVEVQIAVHVSRDQAIVAGQKLDDLDFGKAPVSERAKRTLLLLVLVIVQRHIPIVGGSRSDFLILPEVDKVLTTILVLAIDGDPELTFTG